MCRYTIKEIYLLECLLVIKLTPHLKCFRVINQILGRICHFIVPVQKNTYILLSRSIYKCQMTQRMEYSRHICGSYVEFKSAYAISG